MKRVPGRHVSWQSGAERNQEFTCFWEVGTVSSEVAQLQQQQLGQWAPSPLHAGGRLLLASWLATPVAS